MESYELSADEVILYEGCVTSKSYKGVLQLTLTSQKIIIEREKGFFKRERETVDIIPLEAVKMYNGSPQLKQKGDTVEIQTTEKNVTIVFSGTLETIKFADKAVNAVTGTTLVRRGSDKINDAFTIVDDTPGLDTRGTTKSILEKGVKGTVINGIGTKK